MSAQQFSSVTDGRSCDAAIVIPGIMGSVLRNDEDNVLWGPSTVLALLKFWSNDAAYRRLSLTREEREAVLGGAGVDDPAFASVRASDVLRFPGWAPRLQEVGEYQRLQDALVQAAADPEAVKAFPYDWRLPVEHNARVLQHVARRHLDRWRERAARLGLGRPGQEPQLVLVAHSMGGLVARALALVEQEPGNALAPVTPDVRATVTLGTPMTGAPKAIGMIAHGRGGPKGFAQVYLQELASGLPGVYDLLPTAKCVEEAGTARAVTAADLARLGADPDLAQRSIDFHHRLARVPVPGTHVAIAGDRQETVHGVRFVNGEVEDSVDGFARDAQGQPIPLPNGRLQSAPRFGDGTVPHGASAPAGTAVVEFLQQHGALAHAKETCNKAARVLRDDDVGGEYLGGGGTTGLAVPDSVVAGTTWSVRITGGVSAAAASCAITDVERPHEPVPVQLVQESTELHARTAVPRPGLYRVDVESGGGSHVTQLVMATPA